MLANGATLGFKKKGGESYTDLPGLKEIPDVGVEPEKADNTCLTDPHKKNEAGIGELPDMVYKFKYDNTAASSPYRVMRKAQEDGELLSFQEKLMDGTTTEYDAQVGVKRTGGGVNGVIDFELTMFVQSDIVITDPA
ncbi:phage tail protein [Ruminococcus sp. OA3]|uniref:phage tail protein n=1 Tax=Ruminococcus sp. OA3 TaxID=2914164 RepID=UPI001F070C43|nr:phage tail protein [Ruminococcus sp. OA3]MCH1982485.1 phage tail protein [Ruminococcus sp. OA3]